jgi:SAM-dependent methyltransferase
MYKKAFDLERKRDNLAKKKEYVKLKRLYSSDAPEIPNLNTPSFWDRRNSERADLRATNPMSYDKYKKVAALLSPSGYVLNVGAGSGELEKRVFKNKDTYQWKGTDISPASIRHLKRTYLHADFLNVDINKLPFKNAQFDNVTVLDVLEHISPKHIFTSLKEIKRVLKKGGILIVSVPVNEGLEEMVHRKYNPNAHVRTYTPDLIKAELVISGFNVVHEDYLFAFGRFYYLKTLLCKYVLKYLRRPNLVILKAVST